jgi:hypothetical protein
VDNRGRQIVAGVLFFVAAVFFHRAFTRSLEAALVCWFEPPIDILAVDEDRPVEVDVETEPE